MPHLNPSERHFIVVGKRRDELDAEVVCMSYRVESKVDALRYFAEHVADRLDRKQVERWARGEPVDEVDDVLQIHAVLSSETEILVE